MSLRHGRRLFRTLVCALGVLSSILGTQALGAMPARAQEASRASVELSFTPADRAQIAVWVERDGVFMGTLALTHAVAVAGIGNRPGALQFNSGYRWPYGRREGVLPVWAHRRADAPGAKQFRRVIFQNRSSEGAASRTNSVPDYSIDEYYCLSFKDGKKSREEQLDAVTCASVFSSDKGRFLNESDLSSGYAEPFETAERMGTMRPLSATSLYPPRRDIARCARSGCYDHVDVAQYAAHAREVMPELDAVSRATPEAARLAVWNLPIPDAWPMDGEYQLFIEVNVEGDYNDVWSATRFPTPKLPEKAWDSWSKDYGYPYRGQPSVVYALPFRLSSMTGSQASEPAGYGALQGEDGDLHTMDDTISDDDGRAPGSGADRLRMVNGTRASLQVRSIDPCSLPEPPEMCGASCSGEGDDECGMLICDPSSSTCSSYCTATGAPAPVQQLEVAQHPDKTKAFMWAQLTFRVAESDRSIAGYDVRVKPDGGDWSPAYTHDSTQELLPVALDVCSAPDDPAANRCLAMQVGTPIAVDLAGLRADTHYTVSVAARDAVCGELGEAALAEFSTPERTFTTVSPCFIATAAYGSPLAREVSVLRAVRDRYLASNAPGRMLIRAYYAIGPSLADVVRERAWLRAGARALIWPLTTLSAWLLE